MIGNSSKVKTRIDKTILFSIANLTKFSSKNGIIYKGRDRK